MQAKSGELWQSTLVDDPIVADFIGSKACDIIAEDANGVASQHSIDLIDIKWGTSMRLQSRYVIWCVGEIPTC